MRREIGAGDPPADHGGHLDDRVDYVHANGHEHEGHPNSDRPRPEDDSLNKTGCS
jgi:hypothetical protein